MGIDNYLRGGTLAQLAKRAQKCQLNREGGGTAQTDLMVTFVVFLKGVHNSDIYDDLLTFMTFMGNPSLSFFGPNPLNYI